MSDLIALLEFRTGSDVRRFTSRANDVLWDGHLWYPHAITHDDVKQSPNISKNDLVFNFPLSDDWARSYLGYGPDEKTIVTIYRNALAMPDDFTVFWKGRVADSEATDTTVKLICESIFTTMNSVGLGERMQKFCRHVVYHDGCWLDKSDFVVESTITAIDAKQITLTCPAAAAKPNGYFAGGMITMPNGALRYIAGHTGTQIALWRQAPEIVAALALGAVTTNLYPGCDGSLGTCNDKFNNVDNNGAFYWIPNKDPHGGTSIF
jgi:uncharacterized phage protein (TIGR02218 family)